MDHYDYTNPLSYMEPTMMPNVYGPEETIGDEFTMYRAGITFDPRWELSQSIDPPAVIGYIQGEENIANVFGHDYSLQAPLSYEQLNPVYHQMESYPCTNDETPTPECLVTVSGELPSALVSSLPSPQESSKRPCRGRKLQVGERRSSTPATQTVKNQGSNNKGMRDVIVVRGNGIDINDEMTNQNDAKKDKLRQRSLKAADKCRRRKNEYLVRMQSDEETVEEHHRMLSSMVVSLKEEVLSLKMQLLQHNGCECAPIRRYMEAEARRYVEGQKLEHQS